MSKSDLYECLECGLHYDNEADAKDCEDFCRANSACSIEITQNSIEATQDNQLK